MNKWQNRSLLNKYATILLFSIIYAYMLFMVISNMAFAKIDMFFVFLLILLTYIIIHYVKCYFYKMGEKSFVYCFNKKIMYDEMKSLVFTLYMEEFNYNILSSSYITAKYKGNDVYCSDVCIYLCAMKNICSIYSERINNTYLDGDTNIYKRIKDNDFCIANNLSVYDFCCHNFDSIKDMVELSQAKIYVTKSYLYFNQWTINEFARIIDADVGRITMINDDPLYNLTSKQIEKLEKKESFNL